MTCRVINLLAASPVSTLSLYFQHISYIFIYLVWFLSTTLFTYTLLCMVAWDSGGETFPQLLNWTRLLLPFFFPTSNTRDNGQYSCCVLFLRPLRFFGCVCLCVLCACARAWVIGTRMYVTARSGPLYVCVMYVSRRMCARGRHACSLGAFL